MTPSEELLAAVKEHATFADRFDFNGCAGGCPRLIVWSVLFPTQIIQHSDNGWLTSPVAPRASETLDPTASAAVQSAFARARGSKA